ncbi:MAG: deoxyribodipyrimidine photolyase, partial [Syntrophomonadaceae bacterium]|nr:deoxyribodipyrimidine photolyase [Syntrophomonadaceae bacterium]
DQASTREEYSAATFRPRLHRQLEAYLLPLAERAPRRSSLGLEVPSLDPGDPERLLASLGVDSSVPPAPGFHGGTTAARQRLQHFIEHHLDDYPLARSDPSRDRLSGLSPYLHFGHISPLYVALEIAATGGPGADAFLEQLLVRRELALNFVARNPAYDAWEGLPAWSRQTLEEHAADAREYLYTRAQLERAETHDPYWNAAQREMVLSGTMHGYMRMYWGKKVLEWSRHPREALATALYLNNRYQLDGRDPNSFAGVAWCFGKHDRPWRRRPVFGTVRAMTAAGLRRKFDIEAYVRRVQRLAAPPHPH